MDNDEITSFFVYGTLKRGQLRESCWPHAPRSIQAAYVRGSLFDLGPYPAMTTGEDWVAGELWTFAARHIETTLQTLDQIEGYQPGRALNLYLRSVLPVFTQPGLAVDPVHRAFSYCMSRSQVPLNAIAISGPVASWPVGGQSPQQTSQLPDPFPDFA
jgi:gamma-glutamylcyclotransferase (GGCT)/AIG2-like uncharacterized protein YtfP